MSSQVLIAVVLASLIAGGSYAVRILTLGGSVAAFLLGVGIFGFGGWAWAVPIVTFFLLSSLLSRFGRARKREFDAVFEKTERRDAGQVLANGGIPGAVIVLALLYPVYDFYPLYLGALAAATADTWGTEIGALTKGRTFSVLSFKPVAPGMSGGISGTGTMAGATGALVIALSSYAWYSDARTAIAVVLAGMAGSLVDSLAGATLQVQYRCEVCGKQTERREHCENPTTPVKGIAWINNDVVNLFCALTGALSAMSLMRLL